METVRCDLRRDPPSGVRDQSWVRGPGAAAPITQPYAPDFASAERLQLEAESGEQGDGLAAYGRRTVERNMGADGAVRMLQRMGVPPAALLSGKN